MAQSDDGDGPDLNELLRGAAHGYDMLQRATRGRDPKTRVAAQHLDKVSLQDAVSQVNAAVGGGEAGGDRQAKPLIDVVEAGEGLEVTIDLSETMIEADEIDVEVADDALSLSEDRTGWSADIRGIHDKLDADAVETGVIRNNRLVTVTVTPDEGEEDDHNESGGDQPPNESGGEDPQPESGGDDGDGLSTGFDSVDDIDLGEVTPEMDGNANDGDDDPGVEVEESTSTDGDVPTVEEFVADNPWVRDIVGDDQIDMAIEFVGDQPVDQILGDELDDLGE